MIVAEKPSVAMAYAKVLGATSRQDGYLAGNGYLVSWCVGHLVELAPPKDVYKRQGLSMLEASLMQMDVGPLFGLFLQSFFIGITMRILSIIIFVIVYGLSLIHI